MPTLLAVPLREEGRIAIVTNAKRDAMDATMLTDEQRFSRTAKLCGPGTPWLVPSSRRCASHHAGDGDYEVMDTEESTT